MEKLKPKLYHDHDGNLYIRVDLGNMNETLLVPQFETPPEFYAWCGVNVPLMIESLNQRDRAAEANKILKFKQVEKQSRMRRALNVLVKKKKHDSNVKEHNLRSIRRAETSADGKDGV